MCTVLMIYNVLIRLSAHFMPSTAAEVMPPA